MNGSGVLAFITPNTFLKNKYTNKLREIVATKTYLRNIVLFYVRVFEDPSVDNVVFICQRAASSPLSTSHRLCVHEIKGARFADEVKRFRSFPQRNIQPPDYVFSFDASEEDAALLKKIETGCKRLGEIGGTYFGIQTFDRKKYVSSAPRNRHGRAVIDGGNVFRYYMSPPDEYVDYRPKNVKSGGDERIYARQRIVVRQIGRYPEGTLCPPGLLTLNTIYNIFVNIERFNLKFLLALINSRLIRFYWLKRFYDNKETFPKIKKQPLEQIPVRDIRAHEQIAIIELVDRILALKQRDAEADVSALEREIDQLVYGLYVLTPEEIQIVEGVGKVDLAKSA